jgi:hypothetical protein
LSEVQYRDIDGFPGYRVGDDGSVWSHWKRGRWKRLSQSWRRLRTPCDDHGYPQVNLYRPGVGSRRHFKVHELVLLAFVGGKPKGLCTRHLNGDRTDNRVSNLAYGTYSENSADTEAHGRTSRGVCRPLAKLSDAWVAEIRRRVAEGEKQKDLAEEFGVSTTTICNTVSGRVWSHVRS